MIQEDLRKILNEVAGTRYYISFIISIQTGARRGEFLELTWNDIDFENKRLSLKKSLLTKNRERIELSTTQPVSSNRNILMTDNLISELLKWKTQQDKNKKLYDDCYYTEHDFICTNQDSHPINPKRLST